MSNFSYKTYSVTNVIKSHRVSHETWDTTTQQTRWLTRLPTYFYYPEKLDTFKMIWCHCFASVYLRTPCSREILLPNTRKWEYILLLQLFNWPILLFLKPMRRNSNKPYTCNCKVSVPRILDANLRCLLLRCSFMHLHFSYPHYWRFKKIILKYKLLLLIVFWAILCSHCDYQKWSEHQIEENYTSKNLDLWYLVSVKPEKVNCSSSFSLEAAMATWNYYVQALESSCKSKVFSSAYH